MVTASHSHIDENGVKIVDYDGTTLIDELEIIIEEFVNEQDLQKGFNDMRISLRKYFNRDAINPNPIVIIGHDTRPSSEVLVDLLRYYC